MSILRIECTLKINSLAYELADRLMKKKLITAAKVTSANCGYNIHMLIGYTTKELYKTVVEEIEALEDFVIDMNATEVYDISTNIREALGKGE
jgi:hypothetical protein